MSKSNVIRAWKDEEYRQSLNEAIESPVGSLELTDADLDQVAGGGPVVGGYLKCRSSFIICCKLTIRPK